MPNGIFYLMSDPKKSSHVPPHFDGIIRFSDEWRIVTVLAPPVGHHFLRQVHRIRSMAQLLRFLREVLHTFHHLPRGNGNGRFWINFWRLAVPWYFKEKQQLKFCFTCPIKEFHNKTHAKNAINIFVWWWNERCHHLVESCNVFFTKTEYFLTWPPNKTWLSTTWMGQPLGEDGCKPPDSKS